jgi:hypothetical protein
MIESLKSLMERGGRRKKQRAEERQCDGSCQNRAKLAARSTGKS